MKNANIDPDFLTSLKFEPLTTKNWGQFVQLLGDKGTCGNCWCVI